VGDGESAQGEGSILIRTVKTATLRIFILKLPRRLKSIKSSRAYSRVNWLHEETDVSGTISVPITRVLMLTSEP
jgi:hypothetical protein